MCGPIQGKLEGEISMKLSRREFIKYTGVVAAAGAASAYFVERPLLGTDPGSESAPALQSTNRVKVVRTTCSPNDTGACGINATVSDGRIVTLMPADDYPEPEYNPRGCLRGLSMTNLIYGPDRLKHPLIRVGKRGEGKFRVATWDEALDYAASGLLDVMNKYGGDSVALSVQVPCVSYIQKGTSIKLASMFGWSVLHGYSMNGDLPMFWPMTFGVQSEELESLEWANSKYIAIFGSNIMATRLPDSKFLVLAQERGAKLLVVDPNYSPTASKADEWVPVNPSTDSALAMGIAGEIINKGLYDETFVKTFTDLPLLVRSDNSRRLRARDVRGLRRTDGEAQG
jgi:anaerobic selenocysteine-containing dehydrogenase